MKRLALVFAAFLFPLMVALAACEVDGATPDCSQPNAHCEPAAENANPDAHLAGDGQGKDVVSEDSNVDSTVADSGADVADARDGDAKVDSSDAKTDG